MGNSSSSHESEPVPQQHFGKLRRLTIMASAFAPLLMFVAFLCVAGGLVVLAGVASILAFLLLFAFPCRSAVAGEVVEPEGRFVLPLRLLGGFLLINWLMSIPEFEAFLDRVGADGNLWDWRLMAAVLVWSGLWSVSNYRKARSLDDREIVEIYSDGEPAEAGVTDAE